MFSDALMAHTNNIFVSPLIPRYVALELCYFMSSSASSSPWSWRSVFTMCPCRHDLVTSIQRMKLAVLCLVMQVLSIMSLLPNLCNAEFKMTSYSAGRIRSLATPRRLIVELGNGSSSSSRSVPAVSSSTVLECGDRISEVLTRLLCMLCCEGCI